MSTAITRTSKRFSNNKTGETIQAHPVNTRDKNKKKWKIKTEEGKWKQFDTNSIRVAALSQKLNNIPINEANTKNNVEASIFQLRYHYPNDKSRYRGLANHKLWAYLPHIVDKLCQDSELYHANKS